MQGCLLRLATPTGCLPSPVCRRCTRGRLPALTGCLPPPVCRLCARGQLAGACKAACLPPPLFADFARVADFLHEVLEECKAVQRRSGKKLADFTRCACSQLFFCCYWAAVLYQGQRRVHLAAPRRLTCFQLYALCPGNLFMRRDIEASPVIADIRRRVEEWAGSFPMPGFDVSGL